jgi:hypothetical protein
MPQKAKYQMINGAPEDVTEQLNTEASGGCPGRGRDIGRPIPPAQIPTGGITA